MSYVSSTQPNLTGLLNDTSVSKFFTVKADIDCILQFETALAGAQAQIGMIEDRTAQEIINTTAKFQPNLDDLSEGMRRDGMIVPNLMEQLRTSLSTPASQALHFGATSQDAIDTSGMMRMQSAFRVLHAELAEILEDLSRLRQKFGSNNLMAYTRMQAALPIRVDDRLSSWVEPLERMKHRNVSFPVQLGGPVGASNSFDGKRNQLAKLVSQILQIDDTGSCWHNDRAPICEISEWLSALTGHLGKVGQDIGLMAQLGAEHISLSQGGNSSSMKHKNNPVHAETLVGFARYNAAQMAAIHSTLIHEQERSGSNWLLEWLIMPAMFSTTAAALASSKLILGSIMDIGTK